MIKQALISVSDKSGMSTSPSRCRTSASRSSPPAAPRNCSRTTASPSPKSPTTRASRKCWTAASRRCIRRCMAAFSARRDLPEHMAAIEKHGIPTDRSAGREPVPVRADRVAKEDCTLEDAIENIDIGGPAMLRSAAKNHRDVTVVVDPADYAVVLDEMRANSNAASYETHFRWPPRCSRTPRSTTARSPTI